MNNEIIAVRQLPIIEEQLKTIKASIEQQVKAALDMECTEDTVKEVKKLRAELNKGYKDLEARRIAVKKAILAPYDEFEAVYAECVSNVYKPAEAQLAGKIKMVEDGLRLQKREEVEAYFNEYRASQGIDFVDFDRAGIAVTLAATKKSLKEQCKEFIDRVVAEVDLIAIQEYPDEMLMEYKQCLDITRAINTVRLRHKAIEAEKAKAEARAAEAAAKAEAVAKVEAVLQPPAEVPTVEEAPTEKMYQTAFRVRGTYKQLVALKKFLEDGGYEYAKIS